MKISTQANTYQDGVLSWIEFDIERRINQSGSIGKIKKCV